MVNPQTWRALNDRALGAAEWLDHWAKQLQAECSQQNIDPFDDSDGETMVALKRSTVRHLVLRLFEQSKELRRFAETPQRSVRRSPPGFKP
jgi:hypothetical protein